MFFSARTMRHKVKKTQDSQKPEVKHNQVYCISVWSPHGRHNKLRSSVCRYIVSTCLLHVCLCWSSVNYVNTHTHTHTHTHTSTKKCRLQNDEITLYRRRKS